MWAIGGHVSHAVNDRRRKRGRKIVHYVIAAEQRLDDGSVACAHGQTINQAGTGSALSGGRAAHAARHQQCLARGLLLVQADAREATEVARVALKDLRNRESEARNKLSEVHSELASQKKLDARMADSSPLVSRLVGALGDDVSGRLGDVLEAPRELEGLVSNCSPAISMRCCLMTPPRLSVPVVRLWTKRRPRARHCCWRAA